MEKNLQITEGCIAVIGLGYVGLPLAVAFARLRKVIAFDINPERVESCRRGIDSIQAFTPEELQGLQKSGNLFFTGRLEDLKKASIFIIAVPPLLTADNSPDLTALREATSSVAGILKREDLVIFESTVYPGATEEVCIPILESLSGMKSGSDFFVGYSPETASHYNYWRL